MKPGTGARKVCVIGFQKTGTMSLGAALKKLGFRVGAAFKPINAVLDPKAPDADAVVERMALDVLAEVDAIRDSPCPFVFQAFDRAYPGTKFILTRRRPDQWLDSYRRYFANKNTPLREWMYKVETFEGNEGVYRSVYERQTERILDHFRDRPNDLLVMDLSAGDGWVELVNFLGPEVLPPFPHRNRGRAA